MANAASNAVYISSREATCTGCSEVLPEGTWIYLEPKGSAFCLRCADLDHLIFLPSGTTALTSRSKKHSALSAVVLKWSSARRRNERQGLLVEEQALETAEQECLADEDVRARRREREAIRRENLDQEFVSQFAEKVRELFPGCPPGTDRKIAEHACLKSSGRIGRTAAAKSFQEPAVRLAVVAHIRHAETNYDELFSKGYDRLDARAEVQEAIEKKLVEWQGGS